MKAQFRASFARDLRKLSDPELLARVKAVIQKRWTASVTCLT